MQKQLRLEITNTGTHKGDTDTHKRGMGKQTRKAKSGVMEKINAESKNKQRCRQDELRIKVMEYARL